MAIGDMSLAGTDAGLRTQIETMAKIAAAREKRLAEALVELETLKRDMAMAADGRGGLGLLYDIREALGFNKLYPLSHLAADARQLRAACKELTEAAEYLADLFRGVASDPSTEDGWKTEEMRDVYLRVTQALAKARRLP